jgi:spore germination protein YaaH
MLTRVFIKLVLISSFTFIHSIGFGQELKHLLEQKVDSKLHKQQTEITEEKKKEDAFKKLQDSLRAMIVRDSLKQKENKEVLQQAIQFDTVQFKERNFAVKERKPKSTFGTEEGWQKEFLLTDNIAYKKKHKLDSTVHVFGWHPFWMGNAYKSYNFSLLSVIAYFSYEMDPNTGSYTTIHEWKTTAMVDSAHAHGCKVVLSVTNFGTENNAKFLSNVSAQKTFINTLITLLREKNADGVNIDFEAIPTRSRSDLTNFIIDLSSSLRAARKDYLITIALPAVDFDNVYEMSQLTKYVDLFVIMGYEFYGSNSKVAGPIAPITSGTTWWPYNLERAVDEYLVTGVPASKLLLGLPYYGAEWQTEDLKFPSRVQKFIGYTMYRSIKNEHGELECCNDDVSGSKFHVYRDENNKYRQIWYEDKTSLGKKYDWIKDKKIGGIGIWALGYDNGHTELWELIAEKFALKDPVTKPILQATAKNPRGMSWQMMLNYAIRIVQNPRVLVTNPRPLLVVFGSLLGVSLVGVFVLIRYGYRFKRIWKILLQGGVSLLVLFLLALIFFTLKYAGLREVAFLLGGFLIAGILFLIFSRQFLIEKDLP